MRKRPDQTASAAVRERVNCEATEEWAALIRGDLVRLATEAWVREHPDWGVIRDGRWVPTENPRWIFGMAYSSFVEKGIREHLT